MFIIKKILSVTIISICIYFVLTPLTENMEKEIVIKQEKEKQIQLEETQKLEIPDWNWERLIELGTVDQISDNFGTLLKGNKKNLIIAGHDTDQVFHDIHKLQLGMDLVFIKNGQKTKYQVTKIVKVDPTQVEYLEETKKEQLTLITCADDDQKRLIVICEKITPIS